MPKEITDEDWNNLKGHIEAIDFNLASRNTFDHASLHRAADEVVKAVVLMRRVESQQESGKQTP
jgi:hypothetical protein